MIPKEKIVKPSNYRDLKTRIKHQQKTESIQIIYQNYINADNRKLQKKYLWNIFDKCYNNLIMQKKLADHLKLPFTSGPMSINSFPNLLIQQDKSYNKREQQTSQLQFLLNFLKNVKEYYYCWVIYFNQDLKILSVKLFKKQEIIDNQQMFNPFLNLIGIFVNRCRTILKKEKIDRTNKYNPCQSENTSLSSKILVKSISSVNNSTGVSQMFTNKLNQINEIGQTNEDIKTKQLQKLKMRSISPKDILNQQNKYAKGLSYFKKQKQVIQKHEKSSSFKQLKSKSRSHILFQRYNNKQPQAKQKQQKMSTTTSSMFQSTHAKFKLKKYRKIQNTHPPHLKKEFKIIQSQQNK